MKYIESYWVEELPNGVIHLLINCTQREIYFHAFNDNMFIIAGTEKEYENWGSGDLVLTTDEFIKNKKNVIYVMSSAKEKDQLSFYWIPFERGVKREKKILLSVNVK